MDLGSPGRKAKSDINVTPLIDIVLVLLIVFIVMIPGLTKALPVSVPKAASTDPPPKVDPSNPPVVVSVLPAPGGGCQYLLQSTPIRLPELSAKLTPVLLRQIPGMRRVFLKVDGEMPYQAAVDALDQIRKASDQAKRETFSKASVDGGDVKVVISLRKP